jgi:hypothetical protein
MEQEQENNQEENSMGALLSPVGVMMLLIAGTLDILLIISTALVFFFGVGLLFGKIVNGIAVVVIGVWQLVNTGTFSIKKEKRGIGWDLIKKFLKNHWKKLSASLVHIPTYTWTVYSELKKS